MYLKKTPTIWRPRDLCMVCGKCCENTQMILLKDDIKRIAALGYNPSNFAIKRGEQFFLKNIEGYCTFFDKESGKCIIYPYRPIGCSLYPIVINIKTKTPSLDTFCPLSVTTKKHELKRAQRIIKKIIKEFYI